MKAFIDGTASILAAIATLLICGLPAWFTYKAIEAGIAPAWAWVSVAALIVVAVLMTTAFLGKAVRGIAPSRDRRRR